MAFRPNTGTNTKFAFCLFSVLILFYPWQYLLARGLSEKKKNGTPRQELQRWQQGSIFARVRLDTHPTILETGRDDRDSDDTTNKSMASDALRSVAGESVVKQHMQRNVQAQKQRDKTPIRMNLDAYILPSDLLKPLYDVENFEEEFEVDANTFESDTSLAPSEEASPDSATYNHDFLNATFREVSDTDLAPLLSFTDSPTFSPSDTPSTVPSLSPAPSNIPSYEPSKVPSKEPSVSLAPSSSPSTRPSFLPSASPSTSPSMGPSLSMLPSLDPSGTPSLVPSESPSRAPSSVPSLTPSSYPSTVPTNGPSLDPSSLPSNTPTFVCHDEPEYRSPFNELTCKDHAGTSCLQWMDLLSTLANLENLIVSCPVSCGIDCG